MTYGKDRKGQAVLTFSPEETELLQNGEMVVKESADSKGEFTIKVKLKYKSHAKRRKHYKDLAAKQQEWIEEHGADRAGYVQNYHVKHGRSRENAESIYEADLAELERLEQLSK